MSDYDLRNVKIPMIKPLNPFRFTIRIILSFFSRDWIFGKRK